MEELIKKCIEMDKLLRKENVKNWEGVFEKFAKEIERDEKKIIELKREIRQLMSGGMGSFNDLVLADSKADNELNKLRKELFELLIW